MTSISQHPALPPQIPSNASQTVTQAHSPPALSSGKISPPAAVPAPATARSYASATKKPFSPTSAPTNSIPPVAVGGSAPAQHGKSDTITPVNGKNPILPAVPALGTAPTIINGNNAVSSSIGHGDHSRKPSVTISAAGTTGYMPNGGPAAGKSSGGNGIQFGELAQPDQSSNSLAVHSVSNPRITSPQTSPSPIPQPPASGGRPPSSLQGQGSGLNFGFGGLGSDDASQQLRPGGLPQGPLAPGVQPSHLRRESSQSAHSDMSNHGMGPGSGRGGYPQQAGRGRGYNQPYNTQAPYSPGPNFRPTPNQPRGGQNMSQQYSQGRSLQPYPNSPHQPARSPALANAQPIHHPQQGQIPMASPQMHPSQYGTYSPYGQQQGQYGMPQGYDPNYGFYASPYQVHPGMHFVPPGSPRPPQYHIAPSAQQPQYVPGQYGSQQQPQAMSRTSSAVSDRPGSSVSQPQASMTPAAGHSHVASRGTNSPGPKSATFQIPTRKSAGIVIKDPNSGAVKTFDKQPASPAPPAQSPAIISATPTPPPGPPSRTGSHTHAESKSLKTDEEKKDLMRDAVARKIEADKETERRKKDEAEAKALKEKEEAAAKLLKEKEAAEAKQLEAAKAEMEAREREERSKAEASEAERLAVQAKEEAEKARKEEEEAAERARKEQEEEEEFARIEAEMARKEAEAEERYQKKKQAEKEEKARKEAEEAARADEEMKRAEREAEEAEEARIRKLEEAEGDDSKKERADLFAALKKDIASQPAESPVAAETPVESGAATPASDTSMAPPSRAVGGSKQKPAALKLETSKPVEPPQQSAALQSLRSARFLMSVNDVSYPAAIASPNPALNTAAPMGKFRYDKDFLMQFQRVFTEKPSETWTEKVKETVGDTSDTSSRTPSTRTPSVMQPPRSNRASVQPEFNMRMGNFGTAPSGRTIPPGSTSREPSSQAAQRPSMQNPLASFANRQGGFPMVSGQPMSRTPSSTSGGHPQSPRGNASYRGGGRGGSKGGKAVRESDKDAKSMPLTAGADLKPIQVSATGWKPRSIGANATGMAGPTPGGDGYMAPDVVQRKVKAALNKMTPNNFDRISDQILDIVAQSKDETDGRTLRQVIQLTFEKATDEAHWAQMYAEFCKRMLESMSLEIKDESLPRDKQGNIVAGGALFRKYLLNRCQTEFERGWKMDLPQKPEGESEEAVMLSDEYYIAAAAKRRGLGLVRFIGELYKLGMLTSRIMHECVKKLVDYENIPDEAEVESLTSLLKTIGENLDADEKGRPAMDAYFVRIHKMTDTPGLPSRIRFMLMDIIDLRKAHWRSKSSATKGPTTLEEVRAQAVAAEREKEAQRMQESGSRRGQGGGRPQMGRGDARHFSGGGQYGMMPPPDYQRNVVGMDDLRRLGSKGGPRQVSSQGAPSLGPTSMFASRGSNTRRTLGPGGLSRGGEESSASSRTATPPQKEKKEKEEKEAATSANTFSALAALDASETAEPTSPPSTASSPPATKSSTVTDRQRAKSPLGQKPDDKQSGPS